MQEEKTEMLTEEEEEEEEDDDGPPPGFQCIIAPQPPPAEKVEAGGDDEEDEEEGPPPGFHFVAPKPPPSVSPSEMARSSKQDDVEDDEDGPPPGWEFSTLANALPKTPSNSTDISDIKIESNEELDEGPPPGWETVLPNQMPPPHTPPLQPSSSVSSSFLAPNCNIQVAHERFVFSEFEDIEMESKQKIAKNDEDVPPSVSKSKPITGNSSPATSPLQQLPPSELSCDKGSKEDDKNIGDKKPTYVHQLSSPLQQLPPTPPTPAPAPSSSEKAQLVCGTCRKLCVYPRGAKWVQCPDCREVNFVLEAHDVGQVKCGGCAVLLMYPHGAPAVQCSSCRFVTEIGGHNRRPPLSVQQAQRRRRPIRARQPT
ncbi:hypothetical protein CDL12_07992 [Handroanthus impetiginosus]|uniref:Zinc finger LSD1-type domain-containing protein n=1 Tax=Handroanthus impetiginosus TaxID=429701 RepID=A0A2G9HP83_9LAMI|nr:hypothetical protein CDL12_07992 [Handroanthus impetiginosus]